MKKITTLLIIFYCFIINAQQDIVITQLATTGGNSGSIFYFDSSSSISGQDTFNFSYSNIGWQGSGGNSLLDQGLNPDYIISQILKNVPADGSILLPNQFNSYFSVGNVFSFSGQENVLANDDYITVNYNENLIFDVRSNDADLEGQELKVSVIEGPKSGTLTLNNDYTFTYTPVPNFSGEVNFTYEVSDGENSANASVTIKVNEDFNAQQDIVIIQLATTGGNSGSRFYFDSSSSISGQDTFNFSYSNIGWQGSGGNSLLDQGLNPDYIISQILKNVPADGSILLPNQFNSYFSVGNVFSFSGQENVLANDDYITVNYNENLIFDVRSNDADLEGQELKVSVIEGPKSGTLTLNNDYTFTYTPVPNFSGEVNFTYEVSDGENSANASVTIKVNEDSSLGVNDQNITNISIYPNPVIDKLFIQGLSNPTKISVYNILGKEVLSIKNPNNINVQALPSGMYMIRISDGMHQTNRKFIKN